jgi:predicted homoserine dehydrogenase-like protein
MPQMNELSAALRSRLRQEGPIRVGLIGAGKFGSMFLAQVPSSPHIEVASIADLDPERARRALRTVGWPDDLIARTRLVDDGSAVLEDPRVEVVIEATGSPLAGVKHALAAARNRKHIVMVNVEADVLAGPLLAEESARAGVVYSLAYGDQPALVCEMVEWARTCGFEVVAAGKGTKYQPEFHSTTPETVWHHYGMAEQDARKAGMNPQMFTSFIDGTKSSIEMAAIANATGLSVPADGLAFPPASVEELQTVLRPEEEGGTLAGRGLVEVVSSMRRGANAEMEGHLRWGVYVVFAAPNDYAKACFAQYGLRTDPTGRYSALYRPYHLIGLELAVSVVNAALKGEPTGRAESWRGDVVAVAKRDLAPGEKLDGEGGYCVWGKLIPAERSRASAALPIGLAHGIKLARPVAKGATLTEADIEPLPENEATHVRRQMRERFS